MTSARQRGGLVEIRTENGKALTKVLADKNAKVTGRAIVRALSNNGVDLYAKLYDIAMGKPFVYKMDDGRESQPLFPSLDVQRQAAKDLVELTFGKAVPQTEVIKAELEAQNLEQLEALSDEQLWNIATKKREALSAGTDDGNTEPPAEADDGE